MSKIQVGVLGATGAVGQRFVQLLANHPYFLICKSWLLQIARPAKATKKPPTGF